MMERYPVDVMLDVWRKADKSKRTVMLEAAGNNISVEVSGLLGSGSKYFEDFLPHITDFDQMVQEFCSLNYDSGQLEWKDYMVVLNWIDVQSEPPTIVLGYWGSFVNIELRAIIKKRNGCWEMADIYFQ